MIWHDFGFRRLLASGLILFTSAWWLSANEDSAASPSKSAGDSVSARRPLSTDSVVAAIDQACLQHWSEHRLAPSNAAEDGEWCRRLFVDIIGRIPTVAELNAYVTSRSRNKKAEIVQRLLSEEYADVYAKNWSTVWKNILVGRSNDGNDRGRVDREALRQYLFEAFRENMPYDILSRELITATGSNISGLDDFNGAVNFLSGKLRENAESATIKTAEIFLGMQIQCTQCHNHPFNDRKQNSFWELNSFFRQARLERISGNTSRGYRLSDVDFRGENGMTPDAAEVYFEMRNGRLAAAWPRFIDGREPSSRSGLVNDINRREALFQFISSSKEFDRSAVNRMWAYFCSYGVVSPVDDMGPHNPAVMPELLDLLAEQFRAHGYNMKELVKWIALSQPYGLSSRARRRNDSDEPSSGKNPRFSRFYMRPMRVEQLYNSLESFIDSPGAYRSNGATSGNRSSREQEFIRMFERGETDVESVQSNGTIPQILLMMNGEVMREATIGSAGSYLHRVTQDTSLSPAQRIRRLFLAAYSRQPQRQELDAANQILSSSGGNESEALSDIWWAMLNSNEFLLIH